MAQWLSVSGVDSERLEKELARELPPGHVLEGRKVVAHARRDDRDDVAFLVDGTNLCVVHLTWSVETDPRWPSTHFVTSLEDEGL